MVVVFRSNTFTKGGEQQKRKYKIKMTLIGRQTFDSFNMIHF